MDLPWVAVSSVTAFNGDHSILPQKSLNSNPSFLRLHSLQRNPSAEHHAGHHQITRKSPHRLLWLRSPLPNDQAPPRLSATRICSRKSATRSKRDPPTNGKGRSIPLRLHLILFEGHCTCYRVTPNALKPLFCPKKTRSKSQIPSYCLKLFQHINALCWSDPVRVHSCEVNICNYTC